MIEDLYKKSTNHTLSNKKQLQLGQFLVFINVLSHRVYRSDEVSANAKFMMFLIEEIDKAHFDAMIN